MPLFGWTKRPKHDPCGPSRRPSAGGAARTLLRELQWHLEERERALQETEGGPQETRAGVDWRWLRNYRVPHTGIPAADQGQLEALCSQVQPRQTGAILSRFREALAENDVPPWEIVYLFRQVLEDALGGDSGRPGGLAPGAMGGPTQPACPGHRARRADRDEIPTVSSYVDRNREGRLPALARGTWHLPRDPRPGGLLGLEASRGPPPGGGARHQE
ncbi:protein RD3-like [Phyllostomus hastatus]|uniref:protein RD3-like n=1 Tax=Phyllostomus hastatus TaxID=9423 RepID=UPI001E684C4F|nr:protein RD3-like [Phyllostomus hastatus]